MLNSLQQQRRSPSRESAPSTPLPLSNMRKIRYAFISGQRINSKLLHALDENELYMCKVKSKNDTQYDCYYGKRGCAAKVFIDNNSNECFRKFKHLEPHNHDSMQQEINEMQLKTVIKKNVAMRQLTLAEPAMYATFSKIVWPSMYLVPTIIYLIYFILLFIRLFLPIYLFTAMKMSISPAPPTPITPPPAV